MVPIDEGKDGDGAIDEEDNSTEEPVTIDEGEFFDGVDGTEEIVERKVFVVGVSLVRGSPRLVCIVTGPEPKSNKRARLEQHSEPFEAKQQYLPS